MVRFCFRYEIYGYEIYGRRCEIYGSLRDLWEGLRDLWEFARFMGVTRFMGRTKATSHVILYWFPMLDNYLAKRNLRGTDPCVKPFFWWISWLYLEVLKSRDAPPLLPSIHDRNEMERKIDRGDTEGRRGSEDRQHEGERSKITSKIGLYH